MVARDSSFLASNALMKSQVVTPERQRQLVEVFNRVTISPEFEGQGQGQRSKVKVTRDKKKTEKLLRHPH